MNRHKLLKMATNRRNLNLIYLQPLQPQPYLKRIVGFIIFIIIKIPIQNNALKALLPTHTRNGNKRLATVPVLRYYLLPKYISTAISFSLLKSDKIINVTTVFNVLLILSQNPRPRKYYL